MAKSELSRRFFLAGMGAAGVAALLSGDSEQHFEAKRRKRIQEYLRLKEKLEILPYESPLIGGNWRNPPEGQLITTDKFFLTTTAFAAKNAAPIRTVVLTVNLPEDEFPDPKNPGAWKILDVFPARSDNTYSLPIDLKRLYVPQQTTLRFGCDIVNTANQMKESPNGTRHVIIQR